MTSTIDPPVASIVAALDAACDRIAPTWPLDQFIAVNPYWGWRSLPIAAAAANLGALGGTVLTMPRTWFRDEYLAGRVSPRNVADAAAALGVAHLADEAQAVLDGATQQPPVRRVALVSDLRDLGAGPLPGRSWTEHVVHQTGQHCGAYFDQWQATWGHPDSGLFEVWRHDPAAVRGVRWHNGGAWARSLIEALPHDSAEAIGTVLDRLRIPEAGREAYLTAVLLSINGWAAWCAYRRWQARLEGGDDHTIVDLLAMRLTWELLLAADLDDREQLDEWAASWVDAPHLVDELVEQQRIDWVLQVAAERTYQATIASGLATPSPAEVGEAAVQAVFCIDVRSEVFRRALEATSGSVHTRGFAGFFGLPIAYSPVGSELTRPQLPGLLAPAMVVTDDVADVDPVQVTATRAATLAERDRWAAFRREPSSMFTYVETMGLLAGGKLLKYSLPHHHGPDHWEHDGLPAGASVRPRLALVDHDPAAAAALGHRVLTLMGLTDGFAPLVMICGHGSHTTNNPHAAGLDCGACGGQTGEVNARVLADLLNAPQVRAELAELGVSVPATTWFVPALHNTTTDDVTLFDTSHAPSAFADRIAQLQTWLSAAGVRARAERAPSLGLGELVAGGGQADAALHAAVRERANDWSQVRPEWGLAGNAAFVVAPRQRTRHLNLGGRVFMHDYDWRRDPDLMVLTTIMTAPMVVTNWINMQYHASTVDHRRYGSGNKVLHNVVGGRIGVFEGNGGDLRIGLSMQSLHDGTTLRHPPLRLSVFIEAPRAAIETVIREHAVVQQLVGNGWLHLLRIDPEVGGVERYDDGQWTPLTG